jgi:lipopolysaccharide cholinephosphotransferase
MVEMSGEEIKSVQLDILQAIDSFCRNNGIRYSMACGTLLGAVRHKGYIPWDDDIDIYLLREDYNKLLASFPSVYGGHYELVSLERNSRWDKPFAKAFDNRTIFVENAVNSVEIGVNIDVYPIDDVPDDESRWKKYDKKRRFFQKAYSVKSIKLNPKRSVSKNILLLLMKFPTVFVSKRLFAKFLSRLAQKHNGRGYDSVFECVQGMLQKNKFKKTLFNDLCEYSFENYYFMGFKNYDEYLRNGYGNYRELPPEEKRVTHHDFVAWWK